MDKELIAPCGMNCALCACYLAKTLDLRERCLRMAYCAGCRPRDKMCAVLRCDRLGKNEIAFYHECPDFPCHPLQEIDQRYGERYRMSMIANLRDIREKGLAKFLKAQQKAWRCPDCGGTISCHNGLCFRCDLGTLKRRKNKYRWEGAQAAPSLFLIRSVTRISALREKSRSGRPQLPELWYNSFVHKQRETSAINT
jgi:hypothetical protein